VGHDTGTLSEIHVKTVQHCKAFTTEKFELWMKKMCKKFDSLLLNIQDATACSLEKVNFKV